MNNQQAIDRLVKHLEWGWSEETVDAIEMGIHALKETQWIPCSERLPEESDYYMACVYDEEADDYDYRKNWFAHKDDYDTDESEWRELMPFERVTAWMPLPEPYREGGRDEE
mgnify:FL=1